MPDDDSRRPGGHLQGSGLQIYGEVRSEFGGSPRIPVATRNPIMRGMPPATEGATTVGQAPDDDYLELTVR